jgi:hypothetical protein
MNDESNSDENNLADFEIIRRTQSWLERAVIGLNLCPFAKAVHRKNQIRYVVSAAIDRDALATNLRGELLFLKNSDPNLIDTTLIIHPNILTDFLDFCGFLPVANRILKSLKLTGEIQIANFHPLYVFSNAASDAVENFTNRSPFPMLHLLRDASIARAIAAFPDTDSIYQNNIDTMQKLGVAEWHRLMDDRSRK